MIPEIDIWPAAQLMLKRYDDKALEERAARGRPVGSTDYRPSPRNATVISLAAKALRGHLTRDHCRDEARVDDGMTFFTVCNIWADQRADAHKCSLLAPRKPVCQTK